MKTRRLLAAALLAAFMLFTVPALMAAERDVTFLSTSDSHYKYPATQPINQRDHDTIALMNEIAGVEWPAQLGGGKIDKPRGVMWLGDCIDDGDRTERGSGLKISEKQYAFFVADVGLDGTDGFLKYPVFEGWGNHDGPPIGKEKSGFSSQAQIKKRNEIRKQKGLISNVSENGLHYSWDWDDVHFAQLNIYPADKQREGVRYSAVWHDPQGALSFLKADLEKNVGKSGRPVVLMAHMGFDTDWWAKDDWKDFYEAVKPYNVILYLFGHSGTGVGQYAPPGETKKLQWINDGQTENGFFIIEIKGDTLRWANRTKVWREVKGADGKPDRKWDGQWEWKWTGSAKIAAPAADK